MKKIMIIDGGPRKNMNTAQMVEMFAESMAQSHDKWHEEHFAEELQRACEAGKRMAE